MLKSQKLHLPFNRRMSKDISVNRGTLTIWKEGSESKLTGSNGNAHFPEQMEI